MLRRAGQSDTMVDSRISGPSRTIRASSSLTTNVDFEGFGQIVHNPATHEKTTSSFQSVQANQGSATKWLDISNLDNHYGRAPSGTPAKAVVNMFVCQPRKLLAKNGRQYFPVQILERHPFTPQTFVPLGISADDKDTRYLVIVAPTLPSPGSASSTTSTYPDSSSKQHQPKGPGQPDLANIKAFVLRGDQAVTYGPGTWHAPMVVLSKKAIDFVVVQHANGVPAEDCQEILIGANDGGDGIMVEIDGIGDSSDSPVPVKAHEARQQMQYSISRPAPSKL